LASDAGSHRDQHEWQPSGDPQRKKNWPNGTQVIGQCLRYEHEDT
jgi:hypothetical protein